jgi:hypothetical protein
MKKTWYLALVLLAGCILQAAAQPYEHAGGVRAGYSSGITYKGFFRYRMTAMEVDAYYNRHGLNLSAMFLYHHELFRKDRWLFIMGGGAFGGTWEEEISAGVTGSLGMEYILLIQPLSIGIDWKPMWNIYRKTEVDLLDFGLTIRYRFKL